MQSIVHYYTTHRRTDHHINNSTRTFQSLSLISRYNYCDTITLPPSCQYFLVLFLLPFFVDVYGCFHHICFVLLFNDDKKIVSLPFFFSISWSRRMKFPRTSPVQFAFGDVCLVLYCDRNWIHLEKDSDNTFRVHELWIVFRQSITKTGEE